MLRLRIATMKALARKRRGRCISTVYVNSTVPLLWECEEGTGGVLSQAAFEKEHGVQIVRVWKS